MSQVSTSFYQHSLKYIYRIVKTTPETNRSYIEYEMYWIYHYNREGTKSFQCALISILFIVWEISKLM